MKLLILLLDLCLTAGSHHFVFSILDIQKLLFLWVLGQLRISDKDMRIPSTFKDLLLKITYKTTLQECFGKMNCHKINFLKVIY